MAEMDNRDKTSDFFSEYIVEERDTIPEIERKLGFTWAELCAANRENIGETDKLEPGLKLKIPNRKE